MLAALHSPWIVQERVRVPVEPFPSLVDGKVHLAERTLDTAVFVSFGQHAEGCLTRLGTDAQRGFTADGGTLTPTFLIDKR